MKWFALCLCLTGCITSSNIKGYGWLEIKGGWVLQGTYLLRGDNPCPDHSDPYFYHQAYASNGAQPIPYCKVNFQPTSYFISYPEFNVSVSNEDHIGVIHYDSTSSIDSAFFTVKFSVYLIDPILGRRFIKDTTQLFELGILIMDESPNDTLHLFEGSNQKVLNVLIRG